MAVILLNEYVIVVAEENPAWTGISIGEVVLCDPEIVDFEQGDKIAFFAEDARIIRHNNNERFVMQYDKVVAVI